MKDETTATCIGMIVGLIVLIVVGIAMNGWALSLIWNWFVPPLFGLTALTIPQAMGVSTVFRLFLDAKSTSDSSKNNKNKSFGELMIEGLTIAIAGPLFTVGFAWVILQFAF